MRNLIATVIVLLIFYLIILAIKINGIQDNLKDNNILLNQLLKTRLDVSDEVKKCLMGN